MGPAGYSGTPLAKKLGLKEGSVAVTLDAPPVLIDLLAPLPPLACVVPAGDEGPAALAAGNPVLCFVVERAVLARRLPALRAALDPDRAAWICWPKRASKVPTDVTEDVIRELCLPLGLVDVKVCAVDATWSGLRLVVRKELRRGAASAQ